MKFHVARIEATPGESGFDFRDHRGQPLARPTRTAPGPELRGVLFNRGNLAA